MKNEAYFDWLLNRVGVERGPNGYSCLCEIMYEHQFVPIVGMDDNRWYAARRLRINYADDCGYSIHEQDNVAAAIEEEIGGCTFLELLVSLAENMHTETEDGQPDLTNIESDEEYEAVADAFDEILDAQEFNEFFAQDDDDQE